MATCKEIVPKLYAPSQVQVRLHVPGQNTFFGEVRSNDPACLYNERTSAEFQETIFYVNNTHQPITVQRRDGLKLVIASRPHGSKRGFSLYRQIKVKGETLRLLLEDASDVKRINTIELEEIRDAVLNLNQRNMWGEVEILLEYFIPSEELANYGGLVYHYQSDTVVTWRHRNQIDDHPYSHEFANLSGFGKEETFGQGGDFDLKIRYVHNSRNAQPLYMKVAGQVMTLFPEAEAPAQMVVSRGKDGIRRARAMPNYVQVIYTSRNNPLRPKTEAVASLRYDLADVQQQLGIFEHYRDAAKDDAIEWSHRARVSELTREIEEQRANNARVGVEMEREKQKLAAERAQMEREQYVKNQEIEQLKLDAQRDVSEAKRDQSHHEQRMATHEAERRQLDLLSKQLQEQARVNRESAEDLRQQREKDEQRYQRMYNEESKRQQDQTQSRRDGINNFLKTFGLILSTALAVVGLLAKIK